MIEPSEQLPAATGSTINGWPVGGPAPDRRDVLAAAELADVRRVLVIDVTDRTFVPCHEWLVRSGAPIRLEIDQGATLPEVMRALDRLMFHVQKYWPFLITESGAMAVAEQYRRVDLRNGTIDGVPVADWTPPAGAERTASAGNAKTEHGSTGV